MYGVISYVFWHQESIAAIVFAEKWKFKVVLANFVIFDY